ncbi:NAD(P)/FAD-dependent oxidoreductase [Marinobacterium lutimaris]|uniref:Sarcosine oxidase n=1 Tax=Marinobacterium lutimaris TaxID=568106 RepID=A0A1H6DP87_9GAMM|nr:FAD-binding oxidoreductase [Marinobacterium lutimaris]SEG87068.1 sarcosine oxidase [Marinobacterium lutimaris]
MTDPNKSLWTATARPAESDETSHETLHGTHRTDVVIIGAGFTGLTAALKLAEGGAKAIVLDSVEPGFGASGRNGGQVIPGLKYDPDQVDQMFGEASTDFIGRAADTVFELIDKYRIDCSPVRQGWIQPTIKQAHLPTLKRRLLQWQNRGCNAEWLDADRMQKLTGSPCFVGGWIDYRAGSLHPLNFVQGLARAATDAGVTISSQSEATSLQRNGDNWIVKTAAGAEIIASQAVIATNGYSGSLLPKLRATIVPANSFQIASEPLSESQLNEILPTRAVVSDTRRLANYFRISPDNRLMLGGRGTFSEPASLKDYGKMMADRRMLFPQFPDLKVDYAWSGRIAMNREHLPHIHQPMPGLTMALGFNGRGVAMGCSIGGAIGEHLLDSRVRLPLPFSEMKPLPLHAWHPFYATLAIWYYRLRDQLEN